MPRAFISYSHDSPQHKAWVLQLASELRANGIDVTLDQWDLRLGDDVSLFMQRAVNDADRVLLICTDAYIAKSDAGAGGVGYERQIVTSELVETIDTAKFVPLVRQAPGGFKLPKFIGPRLALDFSDDTKYRQHVEALLEELHGVSRKPPLGASPFSGSVTTRTAANPVRDVDLNGQWFESQKRISVAGLQKLKLAAHLELRFAPHDTISKSQIELLNAVRASEIHTFGWPIGVTLENRDEYKPRPTPDGIQAEIAIEATSAKDRCSYDYWAAKNNGLFYLLQSFFEDDRNAPNEVFFNTRIVRVTEALLFASNLYTKLGLTSDSRIGMLIGHGGIKGRTLSSSNPNRMLLEKRTSVADISQTELTVSLGSITSDLDALVEQVIAPLFMLFDFFQLDKSVLTEIVRRFEKGQVS